ncbi:MAG: PAS domain S-box protein [Nitrospirae bacterium]|nr:PAS domain S-box protein [Nitrospirota bacterium]
MKLRSKILLHTVGLIVFLGLTVIVFLKTTFTRTLMCEFKENSIFQTQQLANLIINDLLTESKLRLQLLLDDYKREDAHIQYIFIMNANKKLVVHTFKQGFPAALLTLNNSNIKEGYHIEHVVTEDDDIFDVAAPVLGSEAGILHIGFTEEPLHEKVNEIVALIIGIITVVLALGGTGAFVFASRITRPLYDLSEVAKDIGSGNLDRKAVVRTKDEIGQLGTTFNKMMRDLKGTTVSLDTLQKERDRAQNYLDVAGVMLIALNTKGNVTLINKKGCELLGYEEHEIIGKNWFDNFIHDSLREETKTVFTGLMDGRIEANKQYENSVLTRNGEIKIIEWRNTVLTDTTGKIIGTLSSGEDITRRKEAEKEAYESRQMIIKEHEELNTVFHKIEIAKKEWEKTIDCIGDMIMITDNRGKIKRVNRVVKDFVEKPYPEILGKNWEEIIKEKGLESRTFYAGGVELYQESTGNWFQLNSYPFNSEDVGYSGTVITLHNTTELKQITAKLEETTKEINEEREKLSMALERISSLIQNVTHQKQYEMALDNPYLTTCYELKNCKKEDCPSYGKGATRCWQTAGTFCGGKVEGAFAQKYKNCTECNVFKAATSNPIHQIGEQFNNMMHVLEAKNRELENAYAELKETQAQILQREKMASIGQLAAGVAHEINNPMGFISSNLATLGKYVNKLTDFINTQSVIIESLKSAEASESLKELKKKLKLDYIFEDIGQLIKESLEGAERVKKIVQNLKSFSRVDEAEYKFTDINECIESTLNIVWNELKYKATVTKEYGELPQIKCYPQQINQVFMNLFINAVQAIEKQGEIKIKTWNGNGLINISVSDTGNGIPQDKLSRIFEPFFTTKPVGHGTGLGLSITYDIVKKHKGEITVESEVGRGTTFTVKLPIAEEENKNG